MPLTTTSRLQLSPSGLTLPLPGSGEELAPKFASSMMDADELRHLAATIAAYPWKAPAILVEIGSYVGQTTVFMAKLLQALGQPVPILSIDAFERAQPNRLNPQGNYSAYMSNIAAAGVAHACLPLSAFSQDAAPVVPATIGVLVVDGGHHYPVVSSDLKLYAPKVLPGGFLFIDDYGGAYPDVLRAVDEYFRDNQQYRILHISYFVIVQRVGPP